MKTYLFISSLFLMTSFNPVIGQNDPSADLIMIQGTIQNYFDGWMTGDTTLLSKAMHTTCNLKFVRDGKLVRVDKKRYVGNIVFTIFY